MDSSTDRFSYPVDGSDELWSWYDPSSTAYSCSVVTAVVAIAFLFPLIQTLRRHLCHRLDPRSLLFLTDALMLSLLLAQADICTCVRMDMLCAHGEISRSAAKPKYQFRSGYCHIRRTAGTVCRYLLCVHKVHCVATDCVLQS